MSDQISVTISQTDPLITSVMVIEDNLPVNVGYDDLDQVPGPTGPPGEDGAPGEQGPPGPGVGNLEELLILGNDGGALQIKNIAAPSDPGDAVNKTHLDSVLSAAINAEAAARYTADLQESTNRTNADASLQSQLNGEITLRANADVTLQNNINAEASSRSSADSGLQFNIDAEAAVRADADVSLQANIDSEASNRSIADEDLIIAIDNEASARANADTELQNNINAEENARIIEDAGLQDLINAEADSRATADNTLQSNIDAIVSYSDLWVGAAGANILDAQTLYFGQIPAAPQATTTQRRSVYFNRAGTIVSCSVGIHSVVAGSSEAWSLYIRKNDTTDVLIATVSNTSFLRTFSNNSLNIDIAPGDFIEMKLVCPTWATNPTSTFIGGYITLKHS